MKRLISFILMLSLLLFASSCSSENEQAPEGTAEQPPVEADTTEESSPTDGENTPDAQTDDTQDTSVPARERFEGDDAPADSLADFRATTLDGTELLWEDLQNYDLIMVNIWTTWCGPCLSELPHLGEIYDEMKDDGVAIVGIVLDAVDQSGAPDQAVIDSAAEISESLGAGYYMVVPSTDMLTGVLKDIVSIPTTYFLNKEGEFVSGRIVGSMTKENWEHVIEIMSERISE